MQMAWSVWSELLKQGLGIAMLGVAFYLVTLVPSTHLWPWVLAGTSMRLPNFGGAAREVTPALPSSLSMNFLIKSVS